MSATIKSLPIVASMLAEQTGITLTIGGDTAYTNGKNVVNLPAMPESSEEVEVLAYGYLCHEAGHIRYTEMDCYHASKSAMAARLLNTLEDGRIETRMMEDFPGARFRLEALSKAIDCSDSTPVDNPVLVFTNQIFLHMVFQQLGRSWVENLWQENRKAFESHFGPHVLTKIEALMGGSEQAASTYDIVKIVDQLMLCLEDALKEAEEKAEQQRQDGDGQEDATNPAPDADGDGDEQSDAHQQQDQPSGSSPGSTDDQSQDQSNLPDGMPAMDADGQDADSSLDYQAIAKALASLLNATADDLETDRDTQIAEALNATAASAPGVKIGMLGTEKANQAKECFDPSQDMSNSTRALRNRIRAYLKSETQTRHSYRDQGSRLSGSRLARLESGKMDVFRHTVTKTGVDTAISLLIDESGSMGDLAGGTKYPYLVAAEAAFTIAESVEGIKGVAMSVSAFPQYNDKGEYAVAEVKPFSQPLRKAVNAFSGIKPQGTTPLAEALLATAISIYKRGEGRKILICATDGDPDDEEALIEVIKQIAKMGVELVGIGIGTSVVRKYFADALVIQSVQDLPIQLFTTLQRLMDKKR